MNLVTGATGLLGSHIIEKLLAAGQPVCALVRPGSNTDFLDHLGVTQRVANLADNAALQNICQDADVVFHCAAQASDHGSWNDFQKNTIDATVNIAQAALQARVKSFVHISSVSVYGQSNRPSLTLTEQHPMAPAVPRWFYYTRAKIAAETHLANMHKRNGLPLVVMRPSWIYGPRDRQRLARLYALLKAGRFRIIGTGQNSINAIYAGNVADACLLATDNPAAIGQAYNISRDGCISQTEFFAGLARALHCAPPTAHGPYRRAWTAGLFCEGLWRLLRRTGPPPVSRYVAWWLGQDVSFPADKAAQHLRWSPALGYADAIALTAQWCLNH